jgi:FMN-dependent NADH-azoreductase
MYNFGITSQHKAWFDNVVHAGKTFRYTDQGPQGLLHGKRAIVVESRGGIYSSGPLPRSITRSRTSRAYWVLSA